MSKEVKITTGEQLIRFIETQKLNSGQICNLLEKALTLFADKTEPPESLTREFKKYWQNFRDLKERPLFL